MVCHEKEVRAHLFCAGPVLEEKFDVPVINNEMRFVMHRTFRGFEGFPKRCKFSPISHCQLKLDNKGADRFNIVSRGVNPVHTHHLL